MQRGGGDMEANHYKSLILPLPELTLGYLEGISLPDNASVIVGPICIASCNPLGDLYNSHEVVG